MTTYNFEDPAIAEMVARHEPREIWDGAGTLHSITCDHDGDTWPCPAVVALREWQAATITNTINA